MIQLTFESIGEIIADQENGQQRYLFVLPRGGVEKADALHEQMKDASARVSIGDAVGMVALCYEGVGLGKVKLVLELPDAVWDNLANCADDLLDESFLSEDEDDDADDLFDDDDWEEDEDY